MASSKKYGYQLRGEKLAICELDITGSGDGLNYTYTEDSGLGITTDPSSWKSPVESITDGLQIEYLSNEFSLSVDDKLPEVQANLFDFDSSIMNNIDWISVDTSVLDEFGTVCLHPTVLEKADDVVTASYMNTSGTGPGLSSVLKVTTLEGTSGTKYNQPIETNTVDLQQGSQYSISFDLKVNGMVTDTGTKFFSYPDIYLKDSSGEKIADIEFTNLLQPGINTGPGGVYHTRISIPQTDAWVPHKISFIMPYDDTVRLSMKMGYMHFEFQSVYIDNLHFNNIGINEQIVDLDISSAELTLPSYAQKALLDYVRAQESYEGGDLEKWDFFMKQFRSKLERWEDSRITGPRVLGPSSSSIR